jgi:amidase
MDIYFRSITEISGMLRAREVTSLEVTRSLLDWIDAADGALGSYVTVCADRAMERVRDADRMFDTGTASGPLCGVAIAFKDNHQHERDCDQLRDGIAAELEAR